MAQQNTQLEPQISSCDDDLITAMVQLKNYSVSYIDSLLLLCAVQLGIPDAVKNHSRPISISELATALSIPPAKEPALHRLMRALSKMGFFTTIKEKEQGEEKAYYSATTMTGLVSNDSRTSFTPMVFLATKQLYLASFYHMASWFRSAGETSAFREVHGKSFWEMAAQNPETNKWLNDTMAVDSQVAMDVIVKNFGYIFEGIDSLVDVGGGTGAVAQVIVRAFPAIKCTVLDLPQVVETVVAMEEKGPVEFVAGDMFKYIPCANAILLKLVLHNWGDEDCLKILQRCKAAIPSKEEGGKVIVIDTVVRSIDTANAWNEFTKAQLYLDMLMMVQFGGKEREEQEWQDIFRGAGFTDYKIIAGIDTRSIIELYP